MSDAINLALTITATDLASGMLRRFGQSLGGAGEEARRLRKDFDHAVQSIERGVKALAVAGYVASKLRPGVEAAADMQEEMIGLRAELSGANSDAAALARQMMEAQKTAFSVQATTPFNIGQIVALEKELVKAGANINDVIGEKGAAAAAAALATYEKMDPARTGQALIGIGTPFHIAASGYADLADQISRAASASTTGAEEIAESAKYAAGPLAGLNRSSTEMLALVAMMAQMGVTGSMAGTNLKNFFNKAAEHKAFRNANGELKTTAEIIEILRRKTEGMGDAKKNSLLKKLFGDDGMQVALALLNKGEGSFEDINRKMREALPLTEKLRMQMEGFNRQLDSLGGTSKSTLSIIFQSALSPLTQLIAKTNEWTASLGKAAMEHESIGKTVTYGTAAVVGGLGIYGILKILKGGGALTRVWRGLAGTAGGVAAGKALEATAGVVPVYVVNMSEGGFGGGSVADAISTASAGGWIAKTFPKWKAALGLLGGMNLARIPMMGWGATASAAGGVLASGAAGYGFGTLVYDNLLEGTDFADKLGAAITKTLAFFGNDSAKETLRMQERWERSQQLEGTVKIEVAAADGTIVRSRGARANGGVDMEVDTGSRIGGAW